ncbi:bumetanide-sensitive sodium-(potassium)-chloride cotransporter [Coccinella septempunctata]|uniref:bumetanide-sensitive sodium-(potassium)-chloride cotransporter n=1 Tax=Coccinella septempunctata TaxID=41139 RepID=UPI001D064D4D|nr:bumetanide-sensitive sodium-(potassium)-chloride cotransporter [Coccinella septempunctata]
MTEPGSRPNGGVDNAAFELREKCVVINETGDRVPELAKNANFNGFIVDQYVPRRKKSLVQLTREALPRLENYRNSRRAIKRPSLGELHGGDDWIKTGSEKDSNRNSETIEKQNQPSHEGIKLGWIQGVLIPCLLNIWGVMLFLRVSWVVAEAGIGGSLIIIGISALVCVVTTLSLSAISTNGEVKGGGIYYIISRSLGPEFGASVGIVFAFANAVSASINTIGFCNSLSELLKLYDFTLIDGGVNDTRVVGIVAIVVMILICAIGMEWESKAQNFLIAIILAAMADFMVGTVIGPTTDEKRAQGFVGFNLTVFQENWDAKYRPHEGIPYDFFQVFAVFFPSVTGIQAGANISGDLKDPASAIPKGTFLALVISMISYAAFVLFAGGAALRDASGNVTDLVSGNLTGCVADDSCKYGLFNSYQMMTIMSSWDLLIYAGCFAATLSTALTNLLSVPRLIQALGIDRIYPGLIFFSKGYGKSGEPYRGYILTFIVSGAFLLIAEINAIAPLISNFYLASYALINFCTFHAAFVKPLGWRPTFKYYNMWLSLAGFFTCVVIMFMINWQSSLVTFIVILSLYLVVVYRKPDVNWGSSTQAQTYKTALGMALRLNSVGEHVKNYKPQILVLSGSPKARPPLVDFANLITRSNSLLILGDIQEKRLPHRKRASRMNSVYAWLRTNKIKGFYTIVDNMKFEDGSKALLQSTGIGKLSPNVLMLGYKNNWMTCNRDELLAYFNVLHAAFDYRLSVTILRVKDGLDYSSLTEDDEPAGNANGSTDQTIPHPPSSTDLRIFTSSNMMHADSNLCLADLGGSGPKKNSPSSATVTLYGCDGDKPNVDAIEIKKKLKKEALSKYLRRNSDLNKSMGIEKMMLFRTKQNKGNIDVWWLYDDGGLTMLLPYIISSRQDWESCKLRIFALATNMHILEEEKANMANLLTKFRLEYSSLEMVSLSEKPQQDTIEFFNGLLKDFKTEDTEGDEARVSEQEIISLQEKTYRQLRLRELLLEKSKDTNLVVMSLPMPRKGNVSAPLYMAWLEALTRDLPPYLLVRGNQQSVLTFYS